MVANVGRYGCIVVKIRGGAALNLRFPCRAKFLSLTGGLMRRRVQQTRNFLREDEVVLRRKRQVPRHCGSGFAKI